MSGASGKVPSAIHVSPEAADNGPLAKIRDGDIIRLDATKGTIDVLNVDLSTRENAEADSKTTPPGGSALAISTKE